MLVAFPLELLAIAFLNERSYAYLFWQIFSINWVIVTAIQVMSSIENLAGIASCRAF